MARVAAPTVSVLELAPAAPAWLQATLRIVMRLGSIALLLIAWEFFARSGKVTPFQLPAFSDVVLRVIADTLNGTLWQHLGQTLYRALGGFAIAAVLGVMLGASMSRNAIVSWFFDPIISIGFPMPKIAFLPIAMLWLGLYDTSKIFMIAFEAIFPIVAATLAGVGAVETQLIWSARNMGASKRAVMWQVVLPAALPMIFTGMQVALPIAMIVAIVVEMVMGGFGLGGAMMAASRVADSRGVFAGIVEIAIIGFVLIKLMALLRRRLLIWHQETAEPTGV
jgi:ABC-type nitrate/sulfonate/bicarbonate transport system permease component